MKNLLREFLDEIAEEKSDFERARITLGYCDEVKATGSNSDPSLLPIIEKFFGLYLRRAKAESQTQV